MLTYAVQRSVVSRAEVQKCREKLRYDTQAQARATAMWMTILHNEDFIEYRCEADGGEPHWHVAHAEPPPRKRKRGNA
jgi:hypothetical protein